MSAKRGREEEEETVPNKQAKPLSLVVRGDWVECRLEQRSPSGLVARLHVMGGVLELTDELVSLFCGMLAEEPGMEPLIQAGRMWMDQADPATLRARLTLCGSDGHPILGPLVALFRTPADMGIRYEFQTAPRDVVIPLLVRAFELPNETCAKLVLAWVTES